MLSINNSQYVEIKLPTEKHFKLHLKKKKKRRIYIVKDAENQLTTHI